MKRLFLLMASTLLLASVTAMPVHAANTKPAGSGSSDTDSLSPKNTPNAPSASSAEPAPPSSQEAPPPDNKAPPPAAVTGISARDPQTVMAALSALGYPGKLEKMDSGRTSISAQISGLKTYVDFYDCADDLTDCYTLLFNVSLSLKDGATPDQANEWNSKQITGRVWLDDKKQPTLDYSLSTFNGVSEDSFDQNVKLWDKKIGDFKTFFKF